MRFISHLSRGSWGVDGNEFMMAHRFLIFRALVLAILIFLAFKPVVVRPDHFGVTRWAALIDTSASMRVADPSVRLAQVQRALSVDAGKLGDVEFFQFGEKTESVASTDIGALKP